MRRLLLILIFAVAFSSIMTGQATQYLYVGDETIISAPSPPNSGAALYQTAWGSREAGLSVSKYGSYGAKVKVTSYFSGIGQIQCDYYWNWYSGNTMHTNHATTYYNFKCNQVKISFDRTSLALNAGSNALLTLVYSPSSVRVKPNVIWASSNPSVASVSGSGVVTAVSSGYAIITATSDQETTATCSVTVSGSSSGGDGGIGGGSGSTGGDSSGTGGGGSNSGELLNVEIPGTMHIMQGYASQLQCTFYPANANTSLSWTTSDTDVASVSSSGVVRALKPGTSKVRVIADNGLNSSCKVIVMEIPDCVDKSQLSSGMDRITALFSKSLLKL